jgi:hypothetical protein
MSDHDDSDHDMRRFVPTLSQVLKETAPEVLAERKRAALDAAYDNPELQAALAARQRPSEPSVPPSEAPIGPAAPATSPWAVAEAIDKDALPSAMAPPGAAKSNVQAPARGVSPKWLVVGAFFVVAPLIAIVLGRGRPAVPDPPMARPLPSQSLAAPPRASEPGPISTGAPAASPSVTVSSSAPAAPSSALKSPRPRPSSGEPFGGASAAPSAAASPAPEVSGPIYGKAKPEF